VRGDDDVAALDREVLDRVVRHVEAQRLPVRAVVERHVDAVLGGGIQQGASLRVLADAHDTAD
jgi:hypothetical protein